MTISEQAIMRKGYLHFVQVVVVVLLAGQVHLELPWVDGRLLLPLFVGSALPDDGDLICIGHILKFLRF